MEYYEQLFQTMCTDCKVQNDTYNYLNFLKAIIVLQQKPLEFDIDELRSLFMRFKDGDDYIKKPLQHNEPQWEQLTFWDIIDETKI